MEMSDKDMHRADGLPSNQSNVLEEVLITGEQDSRPIDLASILEWKEIIMPARCAIPCNSAMQKQGTVDRQR